MVYTERFEVPMQVAVHAKFDVARVWLGCVLLLTVGTARAQQHPLSVTVVDPGGLPVVGAAVTLSGGPNAATNASGIAQFQVPAGSVAVRATAPGMDSGPHRTSGPEIRLVLQPLGVAEAVTVTATRSSGVVGEHAETIDVLTPRELRQFPALTLDESLRQHAGFELYRRAGSRVANPTSEGISLRGLGSTAVSRTLVLEESVPVNDPFGGWIHWDETAPEAIAAVTIATGGGSDLYGSSALGGVVDIVPGRPTASLGDFAASGGGQSTSDVSGRLDRGIGGWLGTVAGEGFRTGGYIPTNPASAGPIDQPANAHTQNGHTEIDRMLGSGRAFLMGNVLNEARGNGTTNTNNGTRLWRYIGGDDWAARSRWSGRFRAFGTDEGYRQTFSSIPATRQTESLTRRQRVRVQEMGLSTDAATHLGDFAFVAGADVRDIRANDVETPISAGVVTSIQDTTARQRFAGGFGEMLYAHGGWPGAASVRVDHAANLDTIQRVNAASTPVADRAEVVADPRLGIVRRLNERFSLKAAAFRGFRSPTMNELYRTGQVGQELTQPNANLLSERATGWEAGLNAGSSSDRLSGSATYFWTEINRPVSAVLVSQTATSITDKRQNLGQLRSQGLELRGVVRVVRGVTGTVEYQFANAVITQFSANTLLVGNKLPEIPQNAVTAQLRAERGRWGSYTLAVRRSGTIFDDTANMTVLRGFFQMDVYGERTIGRGWVGFGQIQNLFNQRADVSRTPTLTLGSGILAEAGVKVVFGRR